MNNPVRHLPKSNGRSKKHIVNLRDKLYIVTQRINAISNTLLNVPIKEKEKIALLLNQRFTLMNEFEHLSIIMNVNGEEVLSV
jgi:hypothetical protein